jgi:hypothetical protein
MTDTTTQALPTITVTLLGKSQTFTLYENGTMAAKVVKNADGLRSIAFARTNGVKLSHHPMLVPLEMVPLLVNKRDQWMKGVLCKCSACKAMTPAGELDCGMCEDCYDQAGEENRIADGG